MPQAENDLDRLRQEYANRQQRLQTSNRYSFFNPSYQYTIQQRQRDVLAALRQVGIQSLDGLKLLELGCGQGGVLLEWLSWGARPCALHGAELLPDRLAAAHQILPHFPLVCADGQFLPYASHTFDLVLQYTVFSSVLDSAIKQNLAQEMCRMVRPGGFILWYDFWLNPTNRQTKGIRSGEIRSLFPDCHVTLRRITLAPPVTRYLIRLSWLACNVLERLRIFNTHYLAVIQPVTNY